MASTGAARRSGPPRLINDEWATFQSPNGQTCVGREYICPGEWVSSAYGTIVNLEAREEDLQVLSVYKVGDEFLETLGMKYAPHESQ